MIKLEDLLKGMIIQSGNDASVALAEHVAGSEGTFVLFMNDYAQEIGMTNTRFENSSGLPHKTNTQLPKIWLSSHLQSSKISLIL